MDALLTIEKRDYTAPMVERMNRQSRTWYNKNREKALDYDSKKRNRNKQRLIINPLWRRCYGGLT